MVRREIDGYERLANAIIAFAAKEYKKAYRKYNRSLLKTSKKAERDRIDAKGEMKSLENFFYSDWFTMLTDLDPDALLEGIKKMSK